MTPVEKCFIHRLIDSFTEFLFERLMGDHRYFGLCRGCTVAKQNFLEHLGVLTVGHAKLPLHFPCGWEEPQPTEIQTEVGVFYPTKF